MVMKYARDGINALEALRLALRRGDEARARSLCAHPRLAFWKGSGTQTASWDMGQCGPRV